MGAGFRELEVWKKAMDFAQSIYVLSARFPQQEQFGLTAQMRRASVSVASCIAEGHGRGSPREFGRFISIALGSLAETETQLLLAERLGYVDRRVEDTLASAAEIGRMLNGLRKSLERKGSEPPSR